MYKRGEKQKREKNEKLAEAGLLEKLKHGAYVLTEEGKKHGEIKGPYNTAYWSKDVASIIGNPKKYLKFVNDNFR